MMYPLASELTVGGVPVAVTCRVLKLVRQDYYRWLASPITASDLEEAYLANAFFDAHRDDPEFGYRFLADEVKESGFSACERTIWKVCSTNGWWSSFGKKKGRRKPAKVHTPAHDDLVRRRFKDDTLDQLWLGDITEHQTKEGKLYLCAIKDACSNRIVGYSIDERMKARLAVAAINNAVARRGDVAGCVFHTDRGSQFRSRKVHRTLTRHNMVGSMGQVGSAGDNVGHGVLLRTAAKERAQHQALGHSRGAPHRHRHLDRADLSPPPASGRSWPVDPCGVRGHHDPADHRSCQPNLSPNRAAVPPATTPPFHAHLRPRGPGRPVIGATLGRTQVAGKERRP
jgi:putative transposase